MIAQLPISTIISDPNRPDGPIIYVNRAFEEVTGYSAHLAVGRNCRFLQGDDTDQPGLATLRAALADGEGCVADLWNYRADGEPFRNRLMVSPFRDATGNPNAFVGMQCEIADDHAGAGIGDEEVTEMLRAVQDRVHDPSPS